MIIETGTRKMGVVQEITEIIAMTENTPEIKGLQLNPKFIHEQILNSND